MTKIEMIDISEEIKVKNEDDKKRKTAKKNDSVEKRKICLKALLKASKHTTTYEDERGKRSYTDVPKKIFDLLEELDKTIPGTKTSLKMNVLEKTGIDLGTIRVKQEKRKKGSKKDDKIQICTLATNDRIIEEIYDTEKKTAKFLVYYREIGEMEEKEEIESFTPKIDEGLRKGNVILPDGVEDYGSPKELKDEIKKFIHDYVDVSEKFEEISAWYALLTWMYDKLKIIPYLRPIGDTGIGKTRFLKVVGGLCYHSIRGSGAITPAPLYRCIEQWNPTLILDEFDLEHSNEKNELIKIINCGFERNIPVMRCKKDNPDVIEYHDPFCPKLIATRYPFEDPATESRCITEEMKTTKRKDIPIILPKKFYEKQKELQRKLLKFRFDYYYKVDSDVSKEIQKELQKDTDRRILQAMSPFLCLTEIPGLKEIFRDYIKDYNIALIEKRQDSQTGIVVNALFDMTKIGMEIDEKEDSEQTKIDPSKRLENLKITPGDIATYIKENLKIDISNRRVGRELKAVGIVNKSEWDKVEKKTKRFLILNPDLLDDLQMKYRLPKERIPYINYKPYKTYEGVTSDFLRNREKDMIDQSPKRTTVSDVRNVRNVRTHDKIQDLLKIIDDCDIVDGADIKCIKEHAAKKDMSSEFVDKAMDDLLNRGDIFMIGKKYRVLTPFEDRIKEESVAEGSS